MATMYDRLGDLLNETLEMGEVKFVRVPLPEEDDVVEENEKDSSFAEEKAEEIINRIKADRLNRLREQEMEYQMHPEATIYHFGDADNIYTTPYTPKRSFVYKKISPEVERSCRLLDVRTDSSIEDVKTAYKDKLKYYHPDHYEGNAVLQKVASDKTKQIVEAYKILMDFLQN